MEKRPGPKFRAPFKASGSQASQPGPDHQQRKTTKISEFPIAGRPVPQFLSSPPATQDQSLPPAAAAKLDISQVNSQSKCVSPTRSFSTVSRAEYPSPPVQQREILLENPDICDTVHATGKKMAKTKKGTGTLPVKKDKQAAAHKENPKELGRTTAHKEPPADKEAKRPRRRPLSRMDDEENTTHSKMAAKKAKCQGTREHESVSGSSQDYQSNVLLLTADTLTEEVVASVQAAVEFCLAVQFQSGSTSFKCKTSLTQAVLWI